MKHPDGVGQSTAQRIPRQRRAGLGAAQRADVSIAIGERGAVQIDERTVVINAAVIEAAETGRFPNARSVALERATGRAVRISRRRGVVGIEARTVAVPGRRHRRPVERRVPHFLLAVRIAHADLQRVEPAAFADVEFEVGASRGFLRVVVFPVILDERHVVVVRVGEAARGVVDVRARQQLDLRRAVRVGRVLHIRHGSRGDQDVVVVGLRLDALDIEGAANSVGDVPTQVHRDVSRAFGVPEVARFVRDIQALTIGRATTIAAVVHERACRARRILD